MQSQAMQKIIRIPDQEPLNLGKLAAASPQEQKQIIGERLNPLIQSREALAKTQEAVVVLRAHSAKEISQRKSNSSFSSK